jgi:hypothetical protein
MCESLAKEFEMALTFERRAALARKWDVTLKEGHVFQLMLDLLERQERESSWPLRKAHTAESKFQSSNSIWGQT